MNYRKGYTTSPKWEGVTTEDQLNDVKKAVMELELIIEQQNKKINDNSCKIEKQEKTLVRSTELLMKFKNGTDMTLSRVSSFIYIAGGGFIVYMLFNVFA